MTRLEQKHDLLVKLGKLLGPLEHLMEHPDRYDEQERAETLARYFAEFEKLIQDFRGFSKGQPGHEYLIECDRFTNALVVLRHHLVGGGDLKSKLPEAMANARAAITAVPIPRTSCILEAGSPDLDKGPIAGEASF
jgi:hypothetical protein